ncbi:MAG: lipase maturation factor family protein, partial [Thermoanaerobaculia bacterium]
MGPEADRPAFRIGNDLFLRLVGLCFAIAFCSLWVQIDGLVGSRGILPAGEFLSWVRAQTGPGRFWLLPTLCWLGAGDGFLYLLCGAGTAAALCAVRGFAPAAALFLCWAFYLSLSTVGQVFLEFQWDVLLLETGLLAFLFAPFRLWPSRAGLAPVPAALWLQRWLLFRLMFSSGFVKLASGDAAWGSLTALRFYYETQPLPPWTAWFMHQLPPWIQTVSCTVMFAVELVVPFFVFGPRRLRLAAFWAFAFLQAAIA